MKYGRYDVVAEIGRGSMGVVYKAHDPQIDRLVALKVLRQDRVSSDDYVKRFVKEATAVGRLSHPGIVTVFDIGQDHGTVYIAMELLEGTPLDELFKAGRVGVDQAVTVGRRVAEALHYAHRKGIVHRDIKPANIICSDGGEVKVTDFGIAHIDDPDGQQMTQAGEILGTPVYMSPEQVTGQPVDGRSDVYSLGVILYELTTGERPFKGKNLGALFNAITGERVRPPNEANPDVPQWLSGVIMKAMAREPGDRYPSGAEVAKAMKVPLQSTATSSVRGKRRSGPRRASISFLVLCVLAGGLYYFSSKQVVPGIPSPDAMIEMISGKLKSVGIPFLTKESDPASSKDTGEEKGGTEEVVSTPVTVTTPGGDEPAGETGREEDKKADVVRAQEPVEPVQITAQEMGKKTVVVEQVEPVEMTNPKIPGEESGSGEVVGEADSGMDGVFDNPAFREEKGEAKEYKSDSASTPVVKASDGKQEEEDVYPEGWRLVEDRTPPVAEKKQGSDVQEEMVPPETVIIEKPAEKEKTVVVSLPPQIIEEEEILALLNMTSRPEGARLYVDGEYKGKTPYKAKLSAEKHEVVLQLDGYGDWKGQLDLGRGDMKAPLSVRLFPK